MPRRLYACTPGGLASGVWLLAAGWPLGSKATERQRALDLPLREAIGVPEGTEGGRGGRRHQAKAQRPTPPLPSLPSPASQRQRPPPSHHTLGSMHSPPARRCRGAAGCWDLCTPPLPAACKHNPTIRRPSHILPLALPTAPQPLPSHYDPAIAACTVFRYFRTLRVSGRRRRPFPRRPSPTGVQPTAQNPWMILGPFLPPTSSLWPPCPRHGQADRA